MSLVQLLCWLRGEEVGITSMKLPAVAVTPAAQFYPTIRVEALPAVVAAAVVDIPVTAPLLLVRVRVVCLLLMADLAESATELTGVEMVGSAAAAAPITAVIPEVAAGMREVIQLMGSRRQMAESLTTPELIKPIKVALILATAR